MNVYAGIEPDRACLRPDGSDGPALLAPGDVPVVALVLAGSRGGTDPVAAAEGVTHKALVRVGQSTMLERVICALRQAGVRRVLVSTDTPGTVALACAAGAEIVEPGAGPSQSVALAMELSGAPLLVTTADHALLSPEWVRHFVANAPATADVAIMLARQQDVMSAVPSTRRTWLRFADGAWSGCNLFLLATDRAALAVDQWCAVERERKRPWRLAARLGWATFSEYLAGNLTLSDAIGRVGQRMGISAALVPASHGLAAVDVDKVEDLELVRAIVAGRSSSWEPDHLSVADVLVAPFVEGRGGRGAALVRAAGGMALAGLRRALSRLRSA